MILNEMEITFRAISINESFARACVAAFCTQSNPTIDELTDIKTAVSEAVTNCVVHAYPNKNGNITIFVALKSDNSVLISIKDNGIGIENFEKAMQPYFTTRPEDERSGMGFTVMQSFMDNIHLSNNEGGGLVVTMEKKFSKTKNVAMGE